MKIKNPSLFVATGNQGKLREIRMLLEGQGVELVSALDFKGLPEVEETEDSLEGNARLKALTLHGITGLPTLADDTGLEVDVLGGDPGVRSARFAGEESDPEANRRLLLKRMEGITDRSARFRTVLAFADGGTLHRFDGVCEGKIATAGRGEGGFGYDELFVPSGYQETFAELDVSVKNEISHRGKALRQFVAFLDKHWS